MDINIELTSKQKHLLAICKKYKKISIIQSRIVYNEREHGRNAIIKLVQLGLIEDCLGGWNITQKGMDYS